MWHMSPALSLRMDSHQIRCWAKLSFMVTAATQSHVSVIRHQLSTANYTSRCHTMGPVRLIMRSPAGFHWLHCSVAFGVNAAWGRHLLFLPKWRTGPASLVREWSCGAIVVAKLTQISKESCTQSGDKQIKKNLSQWFVLRFKNINWNLSSKSMCEYCIYIERMYSIKSLVITLKNSHLERFIVV